jgi:2-keto-4-pentenoate hydratase/2-oxohepta-3-ene-1,7-dioic acid hydratase in catechol pathway
MKIIRYTYNGTTGHGLLEGDMVVPIQGSIFESFSVSPDRIPVDQTTILSPVVPSKAVCVGLNYLDHAQEFNLQLPPEPILFIKPTSSVIGPDEAIVHPKQSKRVDFEAELAIVIGKTAKNVEEEHAEEYILGYTCANDVTARDLQPQNGQWTMAKSFDTFCPLGPVITDEVDCDNLTVESRVNGVVKQHSNTKFLAFKPHFLVSYISKIMTLFPGDVILTGTPGGIAPMASGDIVEIELEGIGVLRNPNIRY